MGAGGYGNGAELLGTQLNANKANFRKVSGAREAKSWSALEQIGKGDVERGLLS